MFAKTFSASAQIDAAPQKVYEIIADYHNGHPQILPRPPFVNLEVERGGRGAGSVIVVHMKVLGKAQSFRSVVSEPEPGRVLVESNDDGLVTTFTVEPCESGCKSYVTFHTDMSCRGALERLLIMRLMRPAYVRELENLARVAGADGICEVNLA